MIKSTKRKWSGATTTGMDHWLKESRILQIWCEISLAKFQVSKDRLQWAHPTVGICLGQDELLFGSCFYFPWLWSSSEHLTEMLHLMLWWLMFCEGVMWVWKDKSTGNKMFLPNFRAKCHPSDSGCECLIPYPGKEKSVKKPDLMLKFHSCH